MARFYPVAIELDGRPYTAEWALIQGGEVCVRSPRWGKKSEPTGKDKPEVAAKRILERIVKDWGRQREREARLLERQGQRIARTGRPRATRGTTGGGGKTRQP